MTGSGADTITFASSLSGTPITLAGGLLPAIQTTVTIDGESADITVSGNDQVRVFQVIGGGTLTLNHLTVADGNESSGAGIDNFGGTLTVNNSTISDNTAIIGGGIFNDDGSTLTVNNSTISDNTAFEGGGISTDLGGKITVNNSTISSNSALSHGGGIENFNEANPEPATLKNTIVANNPGGNCSGPITDGGGNLQWPADPSFSCPGLTADPLLGPLQDNDGPTQTHALGAGSAAIDAIPDTNGSTTPGCDDTGITTDQRGVERPQGSACDIGAYELEVEVADTTPPTVTETSPLNGGRLQKTANVTATFSEPVKNVSTETFILERNIAVKKTDPPKFEPVLASVSPANGEVGEGGLATLNPAQDLPKGEYRATITTAVTDVAGNALDQNPDQEGNQPKVWTFTVPK